MTEPKNNADLDLDLDLNLDGELPLPDETPVAAIPEESLKDGAEISIDPKELDSTPVVAELPGTPLLDLSTLGNVVELDGSVTPNALVSDLENAKTEMYQALHSQSILLGTIVSYMENKGKLYIEVNYRGIRVFIPMEEFLTPTTYAEAHTSKRIQVRYAQNWLGTSTEFVVVRYSRNSTMCIGSRAKAHNRLRQRFFIRNRQTGKMLLEEGSIVRCRINFVQPHWLSVNCCGVDCSISVQDVSYTRVEDLRDCFSNTDTIAVKITSLNKRKIPAEGPNGFPTYEVDLKLSRKEAHNDEIKFRYNRYSVNTCCVAEVTHIFQSGMMIVRMPDGITCLCSDKTQIRGRSAIRSDFISVGDRVQVFIVAKDDEKMRLHGVVFRCERAKKMQGII